MSTTPTSADYRSSPKLPAEREQRKKSDVERIAQREKAGQKRKRQRKRSYEKVRDSLPSDLELFEEWKKGKRIKDLAKKYGVSYTVIRKILIAHDEMAYRDIARIRRARKNAKELSVTNAKLYEQWKNGMSTRTLARKYKVSRQTIVRRLKECNGQEYKELA